MGERVRKVARRVPDYPGKKALEAALAPVLAPVGQRYAGHAVQRLLGFWTLWQTYGGMDGLVAAGLVGRSSLYRQVNEFRAMFGVDVSDWQPEIGHELFRGGIAEQLSGKDAASHRQPVQTEIRITAGGNIE